MTYECDVRDGVIYSVPPFKVHATRTISTPPFKFHVTTVCSVSSQYYNVCNQSLEEVEWFFGREVVEMLSEIKVKVHVLRRGFCI